MGWQNSIAWLQMTVLVRFAAIAKRRLFGVPEISIPFRERRKSTDLREWTVLSGAVYAQEVAIATFEFQKLAVCAGRMPAVERSMGTNPSRPAGEEGRRR